MNSRQTHFCQEYAVDHNATRAAIAAGYAKNSARVTGSKLLTNANIKQKLANIQAETATKLAITKESQIEDIQDIADKAKKSKQYSAALKGKEIINRMLGFNEPEEVKHSFTFSDMAQRASQDK